MNENDNSIFEINERIAQYYQSILWSPNGQRGMEFFKKYGLTGETIKKFGLGYADGDDNYFKDRVIFPIRNELGKVMTFVGRTIVGEQPIYLGNSSKLSKSPDLCLYGIEFAKNTKADYLLICEGWIDTLLLHQAGFDMAVGYTGQESPLNLLVDIPKDVIFTSDHLFIGKPITGATIKDLYRNQRKVSILNLSPYSDSAEFIINAGADAFHDKIQNSKLLELI